MWKKKRRTSLDDFFYQQIKAFNYSPDRDRVFIPSTVAARWFRWATNEKHSTTAVSRVLNQRIGEGKLPRLQVNACKTYGRGIVWVGDDWDGESAIFTDIECRIANSREGYGT